MKIRFRHAVIGAVVVFTSLFAILLVGTASREFNIVAEETARERFALVAAAAEAELRSLVEGRGRQVAAQAGLPTEYFRKDGKLNETELVDVFATAIASEESLYAGYFALDNDDFLQVIDTYNDAKVLKALEAPEGCRFAIRRIARQGGTRVEAWEYRGGNYEVIGTRKAQAKFAPTQRPWYGIAREPGKFAISDPYLFSSTGEPGITVSSRMANAPGVVAVDISLSELKRFLGRLNLPERGAVAILDRDNRVLAAYGKSAGLGLQGIAPLAPLDKANSPHLAALGGMPDADASFQAAVRDIGGEDYLLLKRAYRPTAEARFTIGVFAPVSTFTQAAIRARNTSAIVSLAVVLVLLPIALVVAGRVGRALQALSEDAQRISAMDFTSSASVPQTIIHEVDTLSAAQGVMKHSLREKTRALTVAEDKLSSLVETGIDVAAERDRAKLLRKILLNGKRLANCDAGTMYLATEAGSLRFAQRTKDDALPAFEIPLRDPKTGEPDENHVSTYVALRGETVVIDDVYGEKRFDLSGTRRFDEESGYRTVSMLTVPMKGAKGDVIGVLQYMNALDPDTGKVIAFPAEIVGFVEALASQSAVALENQMLLDAQKALVDSMIQLIAGAIDAKSPYTGGHCERVPELAIMLADEAAKATEGPFAEFRFGSEEEKREFRIGAWLHDCGKVTTPEYVVDKATKLETIYNRIHEVRMRFEVLLRDAAIARLEALARGEDPAAADAAFEAARQGLVEDFAFVAECNVGGEFMAPEKIERLRRIAERTWVRHFDDRQGLSQDELLRYEKAPPVPTPATETLLADKAHHVVPRMADRALDPKYGFKVKVPPNLYNFGEVYNLCVGRGTLTEEERFKINEHIIQTIVMLEQMPFPKELRRVAEYAGTHHETLKGTGYPRALGAEQLSVPARIMAIADIFEALTASDRPYKKAKTLSESIKILSFFKKDGHIDPDLFDLFLSSGVHRAYAERFLKPEQVDDVDVASYLSKTPEKA